MITEEELEQSMVAGVERLVEQKAQEAQGQGEGTTSGCLMLGVLLEEYHG